MFESGSGEEKRSSRHTWREGNVHAHLEWQPGPMDVGGVSLYLSSIRKDNRGTS